MSRRNGNVPGCGLVQVVRVNWTKSSRGGQGARERNAVPPAFAIPEAQLADLGGALLIEEFEWDEGHGFDEPRRFQRHRVPVAEGYRRGCVAVSPYADGLLVRYRYDRAIVGAPDREFPARRLIVSPGQWACVAYNSRFSCHDTGHWWYEQVTVNAAWFDDEPDGRIFVDTRPDYALRMLVHLW